MMFDHLVNFLTDQLHNNQLFAGGAILMVLGTIVHQCRAIPAYLWSRLKAMFVIEVDIPDREEAFQWVNTWLAIQPYGQRRARLLTVRIVRPDSGPSYVGQESETTHGQPRIIFSPAPGLHWFFYKRRLVMLERDRQDASEKGGGLSLGIRESFRIRVFTRSRQIAQDLLEEARELVHPKGERRVGILVAERYCGDWCSAMKRRPRPIESVVLAKGIMERLLETVQKFRDSEQWHLERGLPYRLGVLLSGPPGSGKSSAVIAMASHFGMDIAILNLAASSLDDDSLRNLLSEVPRNTLVLIEDIDCIFIERSSTDEKDNKVTFSGLLNAIDGVAAGEGRILVMTTNHPERLDPALVRAGRADLKIEIGHPDASQICRIFERFFPEATNTQTLRFVESFPDPAKTSMAALQEHLKQYASDIEGAIKHAKEAIIRGGSSPAVVSG